MQYVYELSVSLRELCLEGGNGQFPRLGAQVRRDAYTPFQRCTEPAVLIPPASDVHLAIPTVVGFSSSCRASSPSLSLPNKPRNKAQEEREQ